MAHRIHSGRIELHKINGNLSNCLSGITFRSSPIRTSELRNNWSFGANIAGEHIQLIGWNKQGVFWVTALGGCVFDEQIFPLVNPGSNAAGSLNQLLESANAVNLVNHIVTGLES